jgi:hypothetical protein
MNEFYQIGETYRHLSYPKKEFLCIEENSTHVIFQVENMLYLVPKSTRHMFMYKKVK